MAERPIKRLWQFVALALVLFFVLTRTQAGDWGVAHGQTAPGKVTPSMPSASTPAAFPTPRLTIFTPTLAVATATSAPTSTPTGLAPPTPRPTSAAGTSSSGLPTMSPVRFAPTGAATRAAPLTLTSTDVATVAPTVTNLRTSTPTLVPGVTGLPSPGATATQVIALAAPTLVATDVATQSVVTDTPSQSLAAYIGEALIGLGALIIVGTAARRLLRR